MVYVVKGFLRQGPKPTGVQRKSRGGIGKRIFQKKKENQCLEF